MSTTATFERNRTDAASEPRTSARARDDAAMLKAAANLTRDLNVPNSAIYWVDMIGSALLGYAALLGAMLLTPLWLALVSGIVAVLALYRAGSF
ncbi:MAG: fatty acid desaturase, partial [Sphingomicrobium sp.]